MGVRLIPAVLATTPRQFRQRWLVARRLSSIIHLDLMDGRFVRQRTTPPMINNHHRPPSLRIHAMVRSPRSILRLAQRYQPELLYLPVELGPDIPALLTRLQALPMRIGLSINPSTPIGRLTPFVTKIRYVLIMGVRPGRYRARFQPSTVQRLRSMHRRWPTLQLAFDGGVNEQTIPLLVQSGVQELIVGSAVMLAPNPQRAWANLRSLTKRR